MKNISGGYSLVEFDTDVNFSNAKEITDLLKEGTELTPKTLTEGFADGTDRSVIKQMEVKARSANVDDSAGSAYALLKAAELAGTLLNFRFIGKSGGKLIDSCEDAWDEQIVSGVTPTADEDCKVGSHSAKLAVESSVEAGILASEAIAALDLTSRKEISLWIKSSDNTSAGDLQLLLSDQANCASPLETLNIPALTADTWQKVALALDDPTELDAVISVGVKMAVDLGAFDLYIDDVRAIADNIVVKNVPITVNFETSEFGKHNAVRLSGTGSAFNESSLVNLNV
jgi:hypothetical protein